MEKIFHNAKCIWCEGLTDTPNTYINCHETLHVTPGKTYVLTITADSDYALWNGEKLVTFGQFPDYPAAAKVYDQVDITACLQEGVNELTITGYAQSEDSSTRCKNTPALLYVITEDGKPVVESGLDTKTGKHPCYIGGSMEKVSGQLGFSFNYDGTGKGKEIPGRTIETCTYEKFMARPIKKLELKDPCKMRFVTWGQFTDGAPGSLGQRMQNASLTFGGWKPGYNFETGMDFPKAEGSDGVYAVFDMGREESGFLTLDVEVAEDTELLIGWGEHLDDMRVRTYIGNRNFACRVVAPKGRFTFVHPFRRLGGRYLQLHAYGSVKVHTCATAPTDYPTTDDISFSCADHMHNRIYEVCKRTLLMCMHEHYEDCPWREQALYTMDSRNQMLCGYYTFLEKDFPKSSLRTLGLSIRDDDFLELCAPAKVAVCIPCFCAIYLVQMWEYLLYTGDKAFMEEMLPICERICRKFMSLTEENGLIAALEDRQYWNFYEWQDGLAGRIYVQDDPDSRSYDLPLNAFVSMAYESYGKILDAIGRDGSEFHAAAHKMNETCHKTYYNAEKGWYWSKLNCKSGELSHLAQLSQALAVCAGVCPDGELDKVLENLAYNEDQLEVTLSHSVFRYDALMKQPEKYARYVFEHVAKRFGFQLEHGATTFWETMDAGDDFYYAGSLCHAWSAIPAYLYFRYVVGLAPDALGHMGEAKPLPESLTGIYEVKTDIFDRL